MDNDRIAQGKTLLYYRRVGLCAHSLLLSDKPRGSGKRCVRRGTHHHTQRGVCPPCYTRVHTMEQAGALCASLYTHHGREGSTLRRGCAPTMGGRRHTAQRGVHPPWEEGSTLRRGVYTHHERREASMRLIVSHYTPGRLYPPEVPLREAYTPLVIPLREAIHHWLYLSGRLYPPWCTLGRLYPPWCTLERLCTPLLYLSGRLCTPLLYLSGRLYTTRVYLREAIHHPGIP